MLIIFTNLPGTIVYCSKHEIDARYLYVQGEEEWVQFHWVCPQIQADPSDSNAWRSTQNDLCVAGLCAAYRWGQMIVDHRTRRHRSFWFRFAIETASVPHCSMQNLADCPHRIVSTDCSRDSNNTARWPDDPVQSPAVPSDFDRRKRRRQRCPCRERCRDSRRRTSRPWVSPRCCDSWSAACHSSGRP